MKHFVTGLLKQIKSVLSKCGIRNEFVSVAVTAIIVALLVILSHFIPSFQW